MEIVHYIKQDGEDPFQKWLDALKDMRARIAILRRIDRVALGNFGDHKACREGVSEMRVDMDRDTASTIFSMDRQSSFCLAAARSTGRTRT
jgi:putative addiction module killer protein